VAGTVSGASRSSGDVFYDDFLAEMVRVAPYIDQAVADKPELATSTGRLRENPGVAELDPSGKTLLARRIE
jgi:hypothetical protein